MAKAGRTSRRSSEPLTGPALIPAGRHAALPPIALVRPVSMVGSRSTARIHLKSDSVSRAHCLIVNSDGGTYIRDLSSRTHTLVNGVPVREADLHDSDTIAIGSFKFTFSGHRARAHSMPAGELRVEGVAIPLPIDRRVMLMGKRGTCDVPLDDEDVSTAHAVIVEVDGERFLRDLGSRSGTFLNGKKVHSERLRDGDQIRIADTLMSYTAQIEADLAIDEVFEDAGSRGTRVPMAASGVLEALVQSPEPQLEPERIDADEVDHLAREHEPAAANLAEIEAAEVETAEVEAEPVDDAAAPPMETPARPATPMEADRVDPEAEIEAELGLIPDEVVPEPTSEALADDALVDDVEDELQGEAPVAERLPDVADEPLDLGDSLSSSDADQLELVDDLELVEPAPNAGSETAYDVAAVVEPVPLEEPLELEGLETHAEPDANEHPLAEALESPADFSFGKFDAPVPLEEELSTAQAIAQTELTDAELDTDAPLAEHLTATDLAASTEVEDELVESAEALAPLPETLVEQAPSATADGELEAIDLAAVPVTIPATPPSTIDDAIADLDEVAPLAAETPDTLADTLDDVVAGIPPAAAPTAEVLPPATLDAAELDDVLGVATPIEEPAMLSDTTFALELEPLHRESGELVEPEAPATLVDESNLPPAAAPEHIAAAPPTDEIAVPPEHYVGGMPIDLGHYDASEEAEEPQSAEADLAGALADQFTMGESDAELTLDAPSDVDSLAETVEAELPPPTTTAKPHAAFVTPTPANPATRRPPKPRTVRFGGMAASAAMGDVFSQAPPTDVEAMLGSATVDDEVDPDTSAASVIDEMPQVTDQPARSIEPPIVSRTAPRPPQRHVAPSIEGVETSMFDIEETENPDALEEETDQQLSQLSTPAASPAPTSRAAIDEVAQQHRSHMRRVPMLLLLMLAVIGGVSAAIYNSFAPAARVSADLQFVNYNSETKPTFIQEQQTKLRTIRTAALNRLDGAFTDRPGWLANEAAYQAVVGPPNSGFFQGDRRDRFVILKPDSNDREAEADRARLIAVMSALYDANKDLLDKALETRNNTIELNLQMNRDTEDLKREKLEVERLRAIVDKRPSPAQVADLEAKLAAAKDAANQAQFTQRRLQADLRNLEAEGQPAAPDEVLAAGAEDAAKNDPVIAQLRATLEAQKARLQRLEKGEPDAADKARDALNEELTAFSSAVADARTALGDQPEILKYVDSAQTLLQQMQTLTETMRRRHDQSLQRLIEIKQEIGGQEQEKRIARLNNDPEIKDWRNQREIAIRQLNAAKSAPDDVQSQRDVTTLTSKISLIDSAIDAKQNQLEDPRTLQMQRKLEADISQARREMEVDRVMTEKALADAQAAFLKSQPQLERLPEAQRRTTEMFATRLMAINNANSRYAAAANEASPQEQLATVQKSVTDLEAAITKRQQEMSDRVITAGLQQQRREQWAANVQTTRDDLDLAGKKYTLAQTAETQADAELRVARVQTSEAKAVEETFSDSRNRMERLEKNLRMSRESTMPLYHSQAAELIEPIKPDVSQSTITREDDPRAMYIGIAAAVIALLFGAWILWEISRANRVFRMPQPAL